MSVLAAFWPFSRSRADADAAALLAAVTQISRQPCFFGEGRTPDTLQGRLEIMTLNAVLAFIRLESDPGAAPLAQAFADQLFRQFDAGLREAGVGDLTVPKRMRKIAGAFYGRVKVYAEALAAGDAAALEGAIARNLFGAEPGQAPFAVVLADYALRNRVQQGDADTSALFRLNGWASAPA